MILRTSPARWFELLTPRDEVTRALHTLADTGAVELQSRSMSPDAIGNAGLKSALAIPVIASLNGISDSGWIRHGRMLRRRKNACKKVISADCDCG